MTWSGVSDTGTVLREVKGQRLDFAYDSMRGANAYPETGKRQKVFSPSAFCGIVPHMDERYRNDLVAAARAGMRNAFAILNNFPVGAAVLTRQGHIYQGCNTQSVISGMGVCAERSAIDHAVACGEYVFDAIAVVSELEAPIAPCGMCLQYIGEFSQVAGHDIQILMIGSTGTIRESSIEKMLSVIFGPLDLGLDVSRFRR